MIGWCITGLQAAPDDVVTRSLRVQQALAHGRQLLQQNHIVEAVQILEAELPFIDGNVAYLNELRKAYSLYLKHLQLGNADPTTVQSIRDRLNRLIQGAPQTPFATRIARLEPMPAPVLASAPEPTPVAESAPAAGAAPAPAPIPESPTALEPVAQQADPFLQTPADNAPTQPISAEAPLVAPAPEAPAAVDATQQRAILDQAKSAFEQKQYPQADDRFQILHGQNYDLTSTEKLAWSYCRLFLVMDQINQAAKSPPVWANLQREIAQVRQLVELTAPLKDYADRLDGEIHKRAGRKIRAQSDGEPTPAVAVSESSSNGWQVVDSTNFRVFHQGNREAAEEVIRVAELARRSSFEKWAGGLPATWNPKCSIYVHADQASFAKLSGKPTAIPARARVEQRGRQITLRRVDICLDDPACLLATLPHQLANIVTSDLSLDQPIPRWAGEAMAVLAEPPSQVARYLRGLPRCRESGAYIPLVKLLPMAGYPDAQAITPFYVESVSLVDYLVQLKGPKTFLLFLNESPRYGIEKSLGRQYGFVSIADLEAKWLAASLSPNK